MKTIIFDLDGTIADLWPLERATLLKFFLKQNSIKKELNKLHASGIKNLFTLFQTFSKKNIELFEFEKKYLKNQKQLEKENKIPKLKIFLQPNFLSEKYNYVLITGSPLSEALLVLKKTGCDKIFSKKNILAKGTYPGSKKTGEPFLIIKKIIGDQAIVIGDSDDDIIGAKIANFNCLKIRSYKKVAEQRQELKKAIKKAESFLEK